MNKLYCSICHHILDDYIPCIEKSLRQGTAEINLGDSNPVFIASPGYPADYYPGSRCRWTITTSMAGKTIRLALTEHGVRLEKTKLTGRAVGLLHKRTENATLNGNMTVLALFFFYAEERLNCNSWWHILYNNQ